MNRRGFLKLFGLAGGILIGEAIPFNRVWSFPTEVKLYKKLPSAMMVRESWIGAHCVSVLDMKNDEEILPIYHPINFAVQQSRLIDS